MAHVVSAAEIKTGRRSKSSRDEPRPGTNVRKLYDLLMQNAGKWVIVFKEDYVKRSTNYENFPNMVQMLSLTYGLDIRTKRLPSGFGWGMIEVLLAGEYVGNAYLDYVADPTLVNRPNS